MGVHEILKFNFIVDAVANFPEVCDVHFITFKIGLEFSHEFAPLRIFLGDGVFESKLGIVAL